jgi:hypothetical protein
MAVTETYARAVIEYSRMKPLLVAADYTLEADTRVQALPEGTIAVRSLDWGVQVIYLEALTSTAATQGWANEGGQLVLTPAPTSTEAETAIQIVYLSLHLADDDAYPTLPTADLHFVDDLEQAILLEVEADEVAAGPALYTIGQTQVSRVAGLAYLKERAAALRNRVRAAIEEPFAIWS